MGVVEQPFASVEDIRCVTPGSTQPSQQKPVIEIELSRKDLWGTLLFNDVNLCDIHRRPTRLSRVIYTSRNTAILNGKGQRQNGMKEGCCTPTILEAGNRLIKRLNFKHVPTVKKKEA